MTSEIRLNAFCMNCVSHLSPGLWRHPRDRSVEFNSLGHWMDLAKTLERGKFDGIFVADVLGIYDVFGAGPEAALRAGLQVPINDPLMLVPAMATVTEHLGFGITCNLSHEPVFPFARRMSTLDHLTGGRIGWNIVTGYLDSAARAAGQDKQTDHDTRYEIADEYMEIAYRLWEGSWEDGAVLRDRANGRYADPAKVHAVYHEGRHFRLDAVHLCEPSLQRTPVLYQAGASSKGQVFAARHAECVFVSAPSRPIVARMAKGIRRQVAEQGRDPKGVRIFALLTVVPAETDATAQALYDEYRSHIDREAALVLMSGWTGIDFSRYRQDEIARHIESNSIQTAIDRFTIADEARSWTVGELAEFLGIGGAAPVVHGSPARVADELEAWIDETGIDGFNLTSALRPGSFEDFVDLVVPELQRRGRYKRDYTSGTLREKLFGAGPRLAADHPGRLAGFDRQGA